MSFVTLGAMFVRCHAETDFANQTTAAAIVTVTTSKPIKAIIGNSTDPIALLRDAQHHGYKMLVACASCDRRKIEEKWWRTQSGSNLSLPAFLGNAGRFCQNAGRRQSDQGEKLSDLIILDGALPTRGAGRLWFASREAHENRIAGPALFGVEPFSCMLGCKSCRKSASRIY